MTSIVTSAAKAAHSLAASLLEKAQAKPGDKLPLTQTVKLAGKPGEPATLALTGRTVIVGVFGAFTPPCSGQAPGYIEKYADFQAKGVQGVYILTVNDAFVTECVRVSLPSAQGVLSRRQRMGQAARAERHPCVVLLFVAGRAAADARTEVKFIADDQAAFSGSLGLIADATDLVGGPRSKVRLRARIHRPLPQPAYASRRGTFTRMRTRSHAC
jgi:peroxiredoxin